MHRKNTKQVRESTAVSDRYENFIRTKGRRSPTYENLVHMNYSGFTVNIHLTHCIQAITLRCRFRK